ncbi:hypothetical protein QUB50_03155 [Microcoleus sp. A6-C5]
MEGRRKKEEGRRKKEEGRGKKEEGRGKREDFSHLPLSLISPFPPILNVYSRTTLRVWRLLSLQPVIFPPAARTCCR